MTQFNRKALSIACAVFMTFVLTACNDNTQINQGFIDANNNVPTTEPTQTTTTPNITEPSTTIPPTSESTQPPTKPDGFTWTDWGDTEEPTIPPEQSGETETPSKPQQPQSDTSKSLQAALSSLGKTTKNGSNFVAYLQEKSEDGGIYIIHIESTSSTAIQKTYVFYESKTDYDAAKSTLSHKPCDDNLRMILMSTSETFPITNPETSSYVLFGGYRLWR